MRHIPSFSLQEMCNITYTIHTIANNKKLNNKRKEKQQQSSLFSILSVLLDHFAIILIIWLEYSINHCFRIFCYFSLYILSFSLILVIEIVANEIPISIF